MNYFASAIAPRQDFVDAPEEVQGPVEQADEDVQMIEREDYDASLTSIKTPTPRSGGIKRELQDNVTDSSTIITPNAFNKAILARNELELDSLF